LSAIACETRAVHFSFLLNVVGEVRKNLFSTPSDKSDGSVFTKPGGFRIFKDVPASLIGCIEAGWPARPTWIAEVGLGLQSMACFVRNR